MAVLAEAAIDVSASSDISRKNRFESGRKRKVTMEKFNGRVWKTFHNVIGRIKWNQFKTENIFSKHELAPCKTIMGLLRLPVTIFLRQDFGLIQKMIFRYKLVDILDHEKKS